MTGKIAGFKKIGIAALIVFTVISVTIGALSADAAESINERGKIKVDAADFSYVHSTTDSDHSGYKRDDADSEGNSYKIYYQNNIFDHSNIGCTYRSNKTYDMTDVSWIGIYGYTDISNKNDVMLYYVNPQDNVYYHNKYDEDKLTVDNTMGTGNGGLMKIKEFHSKNKFTYKNATFYISPRYSNEYVYLGLAHSDSSHKAIFWADNDPINSDNNRGHMSLGLVAHDIMAMKPDKATRVVVDENGNSKEETYEAFGDIKLALADGNKYGVSDYGTIFRDERATLTYSLTDKNICDLKALQFYRGDLGEDNKTLIYEMDVSEQENQCTFTLTSDIIKQMEKDTGKRSIKVIMVKPVFESEKLTFDFSSVVAESGGKVTVAQSAKNSDGSSEYALKETDTGAVIGTFHVNQASKVGDTIAVDFTENKSYQGEYTFRYYEYRMCQDKGQVSGSAIHRTGVNESKLDLQQKISKEQKYFWLSAHVALKSELKLEDKTTVFNNEEVKIDDVQVSWVDGNPMPTGTIRYHYYTDEACSKEMPSGEFPVNAGTYYVKAVQNQDDYYDVTESNIARIVIDKATPVLKNLKAEDAITYGQSISETKPSGTAETVSGQIMTGGTFKWADESYIPETAGTVTAEVIYTPQKGSLWEQNYKEAKGTARVTVNKAKPTIELEPVIKVYDAQETASVPATVKGIAGEATGQKLNYQFYRLQGKKYIEMAKSPVNAGSYYVSAYVASNANYAYAESDKVELTIEKRDCDLVPVPVKDRESYYVYITNTVSKPQGTMKLQMNNAISVSGLETREVNGRCFAAYKYDSQNIKPAEGQPVIVTASYEPAPTNENYNIRSNTLVISEESTVKHEAVEMTYGDGEVQLASYDDWDSVKWLNLSSVNSGDVVRLRTEGKQVYAAALNAGTATLAGYIKNTQNGATESRYVFFDITVNPAETSLVLDKKETTYCGAAVCSDAARVVYESAEGQRDITAELQVSYTYYRGNTKMYRAPVNAGEYIVKAEALAQRNYKAASCIRKLIINPAEPDIIMTDDKVCYDGRAHGLEPPVIKGIDGIDINSEEAAQLASGRLPAGKVVYRYSCEKSGYSRIKKPTDAGEYTVTAAYIPGKTDNYAQVTGNRATAKLTISPAPCKIRIKPVEMTYTGRPARHNPLYFTGIDGIEKRITPDDSYVYMYSPAGQNSFTSETPYEAGLYYVYAVKAAKGNYMRAVSDRSALYIKQADVTVNLQDGSTVYSGEAADMAQINPAAVTGRLGRDITDQVEVTYRYYRDPAGLIRIKAPVNAGTYYVQAVTEGSTNYTAARSEIRKLTIRKADVVLSQLRGTEITYGTAVGSSQITGTAAGVLGEEINGEFAWSKASGRLKLSAGEYDDLTVVFTPDEEAAVNYRTTRGKASLTVRAFTPEISDDDQAKSYNGEVQQLDEVEITGAEGMPAPEGDIVYTYFKDLECTEELSPAGGAADAGTYYCRIEFKSETPDYTDASSVCRLEILRADAAISLYVPTLGKNIRTGEIKIKGILAGVFDDPTGTVAIYQKDSGMPGSAYVKIADGIEISCRALGSYGFDAAVTVSKGIYDFKAVYTGGSKQNYNICDGICEAVDMSKEPQSIYFEPQQIKREYGTGDISLNVIDQNNGPGEITYHVVETIGNPEAVRLLRDGSLKIRDTGKAFIMAVKAGDSQYAPGYAIAAVDIVKAKTKINVFDQRLTYTGKQAAVKKAVVTSNGSLIKKRENIRIVSIYKNLRTGERSAEAPVNAGVYSIKAMSFGTDHYLPSAPDSARLVITKAKASISMKVKQTGKKHKTVTIAGTVSGLFDDPSGTISLYKKLSKRSNDAYRLVDSGIEISQSKDGSYGFEAVVPVMTDKVYDIKAVYEDGRVANYRVSDGILKNVSAGSDPVPSGDDDSKDNDDADIPDDDSKNDDDKNDDVTPVNPGDDDGEDSSISDDDDKAAPDTADKIDDRSTNDDKSGSDTSEGKAQDKQQGAIQNSGNDKPAAKGILPDEGFVRVVLPWLLIILLIIIIAANIIRRKIKKDRKGEGK